MRKVNLFSAVSVVLAGVAVVPGAALAAPAAGSAAAAGSVHGACGWTVQVLRGLPGQQSGMVMGTDDGHRWAGQSGRQAVVWRDGRVTAIGPDYSIASDVNRAGLAVGIQSGADGQAQGMLWGGPTPVALAVPPGLQISEVTGISDTGVIVGNASGFDPTQPDGSREHGLIWSVRDPATVRDLTPAGENLLLSGVTDDGVLVGTLNRYPLVRSERAVIGTSRAGLQILPSTTPDAATIAYGGGGRYVVGNEYDPVAGDFRPVIWTDGQGPRQLPGTGPTAAVAVNRHRLVAGLTIDAGWAWHNGQPEQLPAPDAPTYAITVNDAGQIGGHLGFPFQPAVWTCRPAN
jgi:hypothetical protein